MGKITSDIKTTPIPILGKKYFLSYKKPLGVWWGLEIYFVFLLILNNSTTHFNPYNLV
tara:strand:+ start:1784 stop:1957 length:174 start_codon:yes stop_codon:yes gene_type:complete